MIVGKSDGAHGKFCDEILDILMDGTYLSKSHGLGVFFWMYCCPYPVVRLTSVFDAMTANAGGCCDLMWRGSTGNREQTTFGMVHHVAELSKHSFAWGQKKNFVTSRSEGLFLEETDV